MKQLLLLLIRCYRRFLSPLKRPCCRFYPTCSTYAMQAITRFGAWHGTGLAVRRILRCNPWNPGGFDAVPLTRTPSPHSRIKYKQKG
jgi:putative membrane protein insertion efficiency factor